VPTYEFRCDSCGRRTEEQRKLADRNKATRCNAMLDPPSVCRGRLRLVISVSADRFPGSDAWRTRTKANI
jgi:putative FmdB family regulatory protein